MQLPTPRPTPRAELPTINKLVEGVDLGNRGCYQEKGGGEKKREGEEADGANLREILRG